MSKHKARQTARIFHATLQLIADEGISHLNMSNVAEAAGVTRQTIYNYFPDVESIIAEAMNTHSQAMEHHVVAAMNSEEGTRDKLRAFAAFYIDTASSEHSGIMNDGAMSPRTREKLATHTNSIKAALNDIVAAGIAAGTIRPACESRVAADLIWGMVEGASHTAALHPEQKPFLVNAVISAIWAVLSG